MINRILLLVTCVFIVWGIKKNDNKAKYDKEIAFIEKSHVGFIIRQMVITVIAFMIFGLIWLVDMLFL